ncbi:MAG: hypothetical protein Greene101420_923 [Parcubacteria group bacterium Greene1014_20]|nr:MAG: hypothetical protein Greene041636_907 [Parcubacteria group bacterium Greene0416_36]TSC97966.1 MAG: hypothetical protein Greene101420_923 [Parcubacteria group bacterium Greene1014_20]TSD06020.1 MAG: hypothetical protein Greene07142_951 [Parcubacteria group bacterium Greene0714_2]
MSTAIQYVGVKEFRQNMSGHIRQSRRNKTKLMILRRNVPIFEVVPLDSVVPIDMEGEIKPSILRKIEKARADVRAGRFYTHEEVKRHLGL